MIGLPALSEADPEVAGEGSIDPLGLALYADRLADLLVPEVTARMQRIRFVTAIAVGAVVTDALWDEPPADGVSTPPVCFEWLVLESFVRKLAESGIAGVTGVPGSSKATSVVMQGKRLGAANYLKTASVFGFNGVYQPLARGLRVVDNDRMAGERAGPLVEAWESDQGFVGFLNRRPGSAGAGFRDRLREAVIGALRSGHCTTDPSGKLWVQVARSLGPLKAGPAERKILRSWLLTDEQPIRRELARGLAGRPATSEASLINALTPHASKPLRERLEAITAFEGFCANLDAVFAALRHISTLQGMEPLTALAASKSPLIQQVAQQLPDRYVRMATALEPVGLAVLVEASLGVFANRMRPADLVDQIFDRHRKVQRDKGKREWFEAYGPGVVVRPQYNLGGAISLDETLFLHPFRVIPLRLFMEDTQP
ncbi:MAG TPA: hypothetical protein VF214_11195 [Edaphobacter sp.]